MALSENQKHMVVLWTFQAPDIVLGDLESKFSLIQEQFTFQMK